MAVARVHEVFCQRLVARGVTLDAGAWSKTLADVGLDSLDAVDLQLELEQALATQLGEGDQVLGGLHKLRLVELLAHVERCVARDHPGERPSP